MSTELFPYEHVPPGLEIVIDLASGAEQGHRGEIVPGSKGGIWNLWWSITLSDNPRTWDDEVKAINRMQGSLDDLTDDCRLIRAQMAELCRDHPPFPLSIDILCEEIGAGHFSTPTRMGCEGRGLLNALGYNDLENLGDWQAQSLKAYAASLEKWLRQFSPQTPIDSKVSGLLGQPNPGKRAFAEELLSAVSSETPLVSSVIRLCHQECQQTYGQPFLDFPGRPAACFGCLRDHPSEGPLPLCCSSQVIDAALICAGTHGEDRTPYVYGLFREENILAYAGAINSWLEDASPEEVRWHQDGQFVTADESLRIAQRSHSSLGAKTSVKEWLTACLLKTVKDNQRWYKTRELIDNYPQATSWLSRMA